MTRLGFHVSGSESLSDVNRPNLLIDKTPAGPFAYVETVEHLYQALGVTSKNVATVLGAIEEVSAYSTRFHRIRGKVRRIRVPTPLVMELHRRISRILEAFAADLAQACCGYAPGRSTRINAAPHCGQNFIQQLDIQDFFPSTRRETVARALESCGASSAIADHIVDITMDGDSLPLGGPCSPMLSNLVLRSFDFVVQELAESQGIRFTRYADDITLSSSEPFDLSEFVRANLSEIGYTLNPLKSRMRRRGEAITVTGLSVFEASGPRLPKNYKRSLRQQLYFVERFGLLDTAFYGQQLEMDGWVPGDAELDTWEPQDDPYDLVKQTRWFKKQLRGRLLYARSIEKEWFDGVVLRFPQAAAAIVGAPRSNERRDAWLSKFADSIISFESPLEVEHRPSR